MSVEDRIIRIGEALAEDETMFSTLALVYLCGFAIMWTVAIRPVWLLVSLPFRMVWGER